MRRKTDYVGFASHVHDQCDPYCVWPVNTRTRKREINSRRWQLSMKFHFRIRLCPRFEYTLVIDVITGRTV